MSSFASLAVFNTWQGGFSDSEETPLDQPRTLDRFLAEVEKRAFQIARISLRSSEDACDVVQDAMLQLARRYGARPSSEWRPLFYRILQNRIRDCQRRRAVRSKVFAWLPASAESHADPIEHAAVPDESAEPSDQLKLGQAMQVLSQALRELPRRQQQAFMLRTFEGMDVADTARAMGCSEGSVKTHYSRAVHSLRESLGEVW